ncbi:MAG TPA: transglycosylase SLT domain-containing protein, partial [Longimicrobiaceae bacterium]|nr:transglycosylase SLT domain-containing protein [Longimicrobiaceae bacterium]
LTTYNSTSYFLYRGEAMGFEYELLQAFAEDHDVALKMVVVRDREELLPMLYRGEGDVVAARLVPGEEMTRRAALTRPLYETEPALVQRAAPSAEADLPEPVDTVLAIPGQEEETRPVEIRARPIHEPAQLAGETVHMRGESAFHERLLELSDSLTGDIEVVEVVGDTADEALIRRVARGEIDLTVSHANLAKLNEAYFTNLAVQPTLGPAREVVWAVRPNAPNLLAALDEWIAAEQAGERFDQLYRKYFMDRRGYRERVQSEYLTSMTGKLSDYDELLKRHAPQIGWDWRLLASQAFQESRFDPNARSWAGALGLLQLMPATAREHGVRNARDPEDNVGGAVRFLVWLANYWRDKIPDEGERLKFILASYNTGAGHVEDARRLAEKHGNDPDTWEDVAYWLLQKSKRSVYTDPVVKYGFARGLEPVTYVGRILDRFEHYKQFVLD